MEGKGKENQKEEQKNEKEEGKQIPRTRKTIKKCEDDNKKNRIS